MALAERQQLGGLDTVLVPCGEAVRSPIRVDSPCAAVAVPGTETYLGLVGGAANSTEGRSDSVAVQWKGLLEGRCQISLHLRLMHEAQNWPRLSGTQTDLMVVPYFLPLPDAGALAQSIGDNAPRTREDIAQLAERHRSQTAVCWCSQIEGRSVGCRSRQMIALFGRFTQKRFCNGFDVNTGCC